MLKFNSISSLFLFFSLSWASACVAGPAEEYSVFQSIEEDWSHYGYVDATGKVAIPPQYHRAYPFAANGLARVLIRDQNDYAFINAAGMVVFGSDKFSRLEDFSSDGLAVAYIEVGKNKYFNGAVTTPIEQAGFINTKGEWIIKPIFSSVDAFASNGLARATDLATGLMGFIGRDGRWRIPPTFQRAGSFSANGLAFATEQKDRNTSINDLWMGYIDAAGSWVIPPRNWSTYPFTPIGIAKVYDRASKKIGYIDGKGDWVWPPTFTDTSRGFGHEGTAIVTLDGDYLKPWLIDTKGEKTPLPGYAPSSYTAPEPPSFSDQGLAVMWDGKGQGVGLIDSKGRWVLPAKFNSIGDNMSPPIFATNGWLFVEHERTPRLVNREGEFSPVFDAYIVNRKKEAALKRAEDARRYPPQNVKRNLMFFGLWALALVVAGFLMVVAFLVWLWKNRHGYRPR